MSAVRKVALADQVARLRRLPVAERLPMLARVGQAVAQPIWNALSEVERVAIIKAQGACPDACGGVLPIAPARGSLEVFMPMGVMVDAKGDGRVVPMGYRGRAAARERDVWDRMLARQSKASRESEGPWFGPGQIAIARHYRTLVEDLDAGGVRGASLEARVDSGGASDGDFIAARLDRRDQVEAMRKRVGGGVALSVRRVRPSQRGERRDIGHLQLVDLVCVRQMSLAQVLGSAGWASNARILGDLRAELRGCLDRMQGYGGRMGGIAPKKQFDGLVHV